MTSRKVKSPSAYTDVARVMDLAVAKPGLVYRLKTVGRAINFKQRCNRYRNLVREMEAEKLAGLPGFRPETAYDILVIRQITPEGEPSRKGTAIRFDHEELDGELIDPETGEEIILDIAIPEAPDA